MHIMHPNLLLHGHGRNIYWQVFKCVRLSRFKEAYEREMDHFLDLILDPATTKCAVSQDDVLLSTRIANACERSQKEGRMVQLEPVPTTFQNSS